MLSLVPVELSLLLGLRRGRQTEHRKAEKRLEYTGAHGRKVGF